MNSTGRRPRYASRALGLAVAAASVGYLALAPAGAEDTGRWEVLLSNGQGFRSVAPAPDFRIVVPSAPRFEPRPQIISLPPAAVTKPATPPDPDKRENPLLAILHDATLRYGDVVVFPDGPKVFRGEPGSRHNLHDFVAVSASRDVPAAKRKMLLAMPVGENSAWSSDLSARTGKIARSTVDVETTGSISSRAEKTVTVRTGRGDVRVIRVPF